jgi:DeoR family deoxyribose operon repressor
MVSKQLERLRRIATCLNYTDKMHLREVAILIEVSEMTIRRDIHSRAADDFQLELYGGFVRKMVHSDLKINNKISDIDKPQPVLMQNNLIIDDSICTIASALVVSGDVIFFDNGIYNADIISNIDDAIAFTGVTNSLNTFLALKQKHNCRAILHGGIYDITEDIFKVMGKQDWFDTLMFSKVFITASGVHHELGVTVKGEVAAYMAREAIKRSLSSYLICATPVFEYTSIYKVGDLAMFDFLISVESPAKMLSDALTAARVIQL